MKYTVLAFSLLAVLTAPAVANESTAAMYEERCNALPDPQSRICAVYARGMARGYRVSAAESELGNTERARWWRNQANYWLGALEEEFPSVIRPEAPQ